ncbi:hypothetical protein ACWGJ2_22740 [Streptomyces sp. NPDC054796]
MSKSMRSWRYRVTKRMRGRDADRGANIIEYVGMLILVAGIIVAIQGLGLAGRISGAISAWVGAVIG